jgi:hypothetical protein
MFAIPQQQYPVQYINAPPRRRATYRRRPSRTVFRRRVSTKRRLTACTKLARKKGKFTVAASPIKSFLPGLTIYHRPGKGFIGVLNETSGKVSFVRRTAYPRQAKVLQKARVKGDNIVFFTKTGAAAAEMATATALAATGVLTTTSRKRERADEADF